jgi:hypothetical protein
MTAPGSNATTFLGRVDEGEQLGGLSALPISRERSGSTRQRGYVSRLGVVSQAA